MDRNQATPAITPANPTPDPLRARGLRYILLNELMHHPDRSVAQLVTTLNQHGYTLTGRASKTISDALRWEVRRGRVERLARGLYRYVTTSRSTARRIRLFAAVCHRWVVARTGNEPLPPIPRPCPQRYPHSIHYRQSVPWDDLQWVWSR